MKPTLKEVKEYFKDAETIKALNGRIANYDVNVRRGVHYCFQGVWVDDIDSNRHINSAEIWNKEKGFAEIITYKTKQMKTLNRTNYKRIYNIACSTWKPKLQEWYGNKFAIEDEINIKDSEYKLMRNACTNEQNTLFDEIFGKDEKELEVGKWYKISNGAIYNFNGDYDNNLNPKGYGFDNDGEYLDLDNSNYGGWGTKDLREATKEEVETALLKEAEKRGFVEGVKYINVVYDSSVQTLKKPKKLTYYNTRNYLTDSCGGAIFSNGKWAEIVATGEKTYKIGQRFKRNGEKYILCKAEYNSLQLICLEDGNRWAKGVKVHDIDKVTQEEFKQVTKNQVNKFTLYKK